MTSRFRAPTLFAAAMILALPAATPTRAQTFSADQRQEIEGIVKNYLLQHPEVMQDVMAELEKRQKAAEAEKNRAAVADNNATIFSSPHQVVLGNPQGNVTDFEHIGTVMPAWGSEKNGASARHRPAPMKHAPVATASMNEIRYRARNVRSVVAP